MRKQTGDIAWHQCNVEAVTGSFTFAAWECSPSFLPAVSNRALTSTCAPAIKGSSCIPSIQQTQTSSFVVQRSGQWPHTLQRKSMGSTPIRGALPGFSRLMSLLVGKHTYGPRYIISHSGWQLLKQYVGQSTRGFEDLGDLTILFFFFKIQFIIIWKRMRIASPNTYSIRQRTICRSDQVQVSINGFQLALRQT